MDRRVGKRQPFGELQCSQPEKKSKITMFLKDDTKENRDPVGPTTLKGQKLDSLVGGVTGAQCSQCAKRKAEIERLMEKANENAALHKRIAKLEETATQLEARAQQSELLANDFSVAYEELKSKQQVQGQAYSYEELVDRLLAMDEEIEAMRARLQDMEREANYHRHFHILYKAMVTEKTDGP